MISTRGFVRKTACENISSQTVVSSDTVLFIPQARDNYNRLWYKKGTSVLYSFLLVLYAIKDPKILFKLIYKKYLAQKVMKTSFILFLKSCSVLLCLTWTI